MRAFACSESASLKSPWVHTPSLTGLFVKFPFSPSVYINKYRSSGAACVLRLHCFLPLMPVCTLSSRVLLIWEPNQTKGPIVPLFTISGTTSPRLQRNPAIYNLGQWVEKRWRKRTGAVGALRAGQGWNYSGRGCKIKQAKDEGMRRERHEVGGR